MADFPRERSKILTLAHAFQNGMTQNATAFAGCEVTATQIDTAISTTFTTAGVRQSAQQQLDATIETDVAAVDDLTDKMMVVVAYARSKKKQFPQILEWIDYADTVSVADLVPGTVRAFEIQKQTPNLLVLDWKGPKIGTDTANGEGGRVRSYQIVARQSAAQEWIVVKTELSDLSQLGLPAAFAPYFPNGGTLEIGARGVNLIGAGEIGSTVTVKI